MKAYHIQKNFKREWEKKILHWYSLNKRDLPWRNKENQIFYKIWISEIMLQQTQVSVVIPFYSKFIKKWPTLEDFYKAKLDDILLIWQGMGYYRRAHNLFKAKEILKKNRNITISSSFLRKLPGIGEYTSGAIAAILKDETCSVVDGNIERILKRVFNLKSNDKFLKKKIREISALLTPNKNNGIYCQSLMDLANLICKVKNPKCEICPVFKYCESKGVLEFKEKKITTYKVTVAFVISFEKTFLVTKNSKKLLQNLFSFPMNEFENFDKRFEIKKYLDKSISEWTIKKDIKNVHEYIGEVNHKFSHFQLKVLIVKLRSLRKFKLNNFYWLTREELNERAISKLMSKIREKVG